MFAVIESGGKQYKVGSEDKIKVEKLGFEPNQEFLFDKVLLLVKGDEVLIGQPYLKSEVGGRVIGQGRGRKKIVFRYHSKTRYRKKKGARQHYTEVKISAIK